MNKRMRKGNAMKAKWFVLLFVSMLVVSQAVAGLPHVVLYDDFDDGNYDGWEVVDLRGAVVPQVAPELVVSPEGWALRGIGTGYSPPEETLSQSLSINGSMELSIEMRAKSGPGTPSGLYAFLFEGPADYYQTGDYGEHGWAYFSNSGIPLLNDSIADPYDWHNFEWIRDSSGWWSCLIDGNPTFPNFVQDGQMTSFTGIQLFVTRSASEIEWVRVSTPEPATLSLLVIGMVTILRKRNK